MSSQTDSYGGSDRERRLKLAKKYNFLILEDDAYAFVHYGEKGSKAKSYFALEKEVNDEVGRVVRCVIGLSMSQRPIIHFLSSAASTLSAKS